MAALAADTEAAEAAEKWKRASPRCSAATAVASCTQAALTCLDSGDTAACWRNPAVGGHTTLADARAVSRLLQEPPCTS